MAAHRTFRKVAVKQSAAYQIEPLESRVLLSTFTIANTAPGAFSVGVAFDGTNFLAGIQGDAVAQFDVGSQLVSPAGADVGSLIPTGRTGGAPAVAFGGGAYLLVWQDDALKSTAEGDDIWGQIVSPSGTAGTAFPISTAAGEQGSVAIASDGSNFLVVWVDTSGATPALNGQLVSAAGSLIGTQIAIGQETFEVTDPNVTFGDGEYFVTWGFNLTGNDMNGVRAAFVSPAGIAGSPFQINQTFATDHNSRVATFNGTNFLILYPIDTGPEVSHPTFNIYERLFSPNGTPVTAETLLPDGPTVDFPAPTLASNGTDYLLSWTADPSDGSGYNVYGQLLDPTGTLVGASFPIDVASGSQVGAFCSFGAGHFLGIINDGSANGDNQPGAQVLGTILSANGAAPNKLIFAAAPSNAATNETLPAITVDVEDSSGNPLTSDNSNVTLAVSGGATLSGATTVAAVNGVATFSDLSITTAGSAYTFTATDGSDTAAMSTGFNVFPPPSHIGGLDPNFGVGGSVSHAVGFTSTNGQVIQAGKTVIIGTAGASPAEMFGITRYNTDGSLDTSFGSGGIVDTSFGDTDDQPAAVAVLADGDILVAGTATTFTNGIAGGSQFALAEYNTDGSPVTTFGTGGQVLFGFSTGGTLSNDVANDMVVSSDGTIIYAGGSSDAAGKGKDFAVAAFNADGSTDTAFGGGHVLLDFADGDDVIKGLALQSNGDLVAAGSTANPGTGIISVALARFLTTGVPDAHFGTGGKVTTTVGNLDDQANAVTVQSKDQKIVIAGFSAAGSAADGTLTSNFLVARYTTAGKIDPSFDKGPVTIKFGQPAAATGVLVDAQGVVVSGRTTASLSSLVPNELEVALARYTTNGVPDPTFNGTGKSIINLSGVAVSNATIQAETFAISPLDLASDLLAKLAELGIKAQSVELLPGGEISIVANSGGDTEQSVAVLHGIDLVTLLTSGIPSAVVGGAKGTATVSVLEDASDTATASITIDLSVAINSDGSGGSSIRSFPEKVNLRPGLGKIYKLSFVYPIGLANGNYFVVATVDPGVLHDLNEMNNVSATASEVNVAAPFVDLGDSNLVLLPFKVGKPAQVTFDIVNSGNTSANGAFTVEFFTSADQILADGTPLPTTPAVKLNLKNGVTKPFHEKLIIPTTLPSGSYYLLGVLTALSPLVDSTADDNLMMTVGPFSNP